jgi:hypothetical protein
MEEKYKIRKTIRGWVFPYARVSTKNPEICDWVPIDRHHHRCTEGVNEQHELYYDSHEIEQRRRLSLEPKQTFYF